MISKAWHTFINLSILVPSFSLSFYFLKFSTFHNASFFLNLKTTRALPCYTLSAKNQIGMRIIAIITNHSHLNGDGSLSISHVCNKTTMWSENNLGNSTPICKDYGCPMYLKVKIYLALIWWRLMGPINHVNIITCTCGLFSWQSETNSKALMLVAILFQLIFFPF